MSSTTASIRPIDVDLRLPPTCLNALHLLETEAARAHPDICEVDHDIFEGAGIDHEAVELRPTTKWSRRSHQLMVLFGQAPPPANRGPGLVRASPKPVFTLDDAAQPTGSLRLVDQAYPAPPLEVPPV